MKNIHVKEMSKEEIIANAEFHNVDEQLRAAHLINEMVGEMNRMINDYMKFAHITLPLVKDIPNNTIGDKKARFMHESDEFNSERMNMMIKTRIYLNPNNNSLYHSLSINLFGLLEKYLKAIIHKMRKLIKHSGINTSWADPDTYNDVVEAIRDTFMALPELLRILKVFGYEDKEEEIALFYQSRSVVIDSPHEMVEQFKYLLRVIQNRILHPYIMVQEALNDVDWDHYYNSAVINGDVVAEEDNDEDDERYLLTKI